MGYDCGAVDGKMGAKTIRAARLFAAAFKVEPDDRFVDRLLKETNRQAEVARVHREWPAMARSQAFSEWIDNQSVTAPAIGRKVLAAGSAAQMISLVYAYRFDREGPKEEALPPSGIMQKRFYKGMAPLNIRTRNEGRHFIVKLLELPGEREVISIFLRSGDKVDVRMPLGDYALRYAVGQHWYGKRWLFGTDTIYSRMEQPIRFSLTGHEISGYNIDLYLKPLPLKGRNRKYAFDF